MSIEHALRTRVGRAYGEITWEQNPLVTIGLTQAILSLRVTDEQLFKIVRGYLKQLAAAKHPDSGSEADGMRVQESQETIDDRAKIMEAFEFLDDWKVFQKALDEFKILSSAERSELAGVRAALRDTRGKLERASTDLIAIEEKRENFDREVAAFDATKQDYETRLRILQRDYTRSANERGQWRTLFENKQKMNRRLVGLIERQRFNMMLGAPHYFIAEDGVKTPLLPVEAKTILVLRFYFTEPCGKLDEVSPEDISVEAKERYREAVERLAEIGGKNMPKVKPRFFLQRKKVLLGLIDRNERIIGSIALEDIERTSYKHIEKMPSRFVFETINPLLLPGHVIACSMAPRHPKRLTPEHDLASALASLPVMRSAYWGRITTYRVLLDIEK